MEKVYRISMDANLWAYAQTVGNGSINAGVVKIISQYKAEDPEYFTPEVEVAESINDAASSASTSSIPKEIAAKLIALNAATDKEAVESGRVMTEEEGKATLYELSAYNYVIHGDTKPEAIRAYIKSLEGSFQKSCQKLKGAAVWRIPKANIDKLGIDNVIKAFAEVGLTVTIGESLMTEEERAKEAAKTNEANKPNKANEPKPKAEAKPKAEKPAKPTAAPTPVISIAPKPVKGICYEVKKDAEFGAVGVEREVSQRGNFHYYQGSKGAIVYVKVGYDTESETDIFCAIAKVQGQLSDLADGEETQKWDKIAEKGIVASVKSGALTPTFAMSSALAAAGATQADVDYVFDKVA